MSQASDPTIEQQGLIKTDFNPAPVSRAREADRPTDAFLEHYFKRINPEIAAGFSEEQRDAIKAMFGTRGIAKHSIELRRSIPFGKRRFYLVFLMGPERRAFSRLYSQGAISKPFNALFYVGLGALCLVPVLLLLYGSYF